MRRLTVQLPGVLRLAAARGRRLAGAIVVRVGGRSRKFSATVTGRTLAIGLAHPAGAVRITIEPRVLGVSPPVAARVRAHRLKTVRVMLVAFASGGTKTRLALIVNVT
jgi:hypothetical protein